MATFEFTVNKSFLGEVCHPITIPKSQLSYEMLEAIGLDYKNVIVVLPRGERFEAKIGHGEAGFGEYFQLQFTGKDRTLPAYLTLNDHLIVLLVKAASRSYAILEYRE